MVNTLQKNEESVQNMFLHYPFGKIIWDETLRLVGWFGENIMEAWKIWWDESQEENMRNLPLIISCGIWLA